MSLPPSSLARAVPASQNTAPVIKFRCLYTHDIRRKAKRWQDGYLKFHTFNKRAMVYDDAGNFIGDHHWRESHDIQDGDELELDKGVLIQVSECMETTQTDISALFDRRKASQESPQQHKTPAPPSGVCSYPRQTPLARPPKSLNDLLGIQKGPIGRSVAPQSPYEQCHRPTQRHVQGKQDEDERPAKRQKPAPATEILQRKSTNEPLRKRTEVIDLDGPSLPKVSPRPVPVSGVRREIAQSTKRSNVSPKSPQESPSEQTRVRIPRSVAKSLSSVQSPFEKQSEQSKSTNNGAQLPLNPLRMRNEKPRQKLMYRALLPPKTSRALDSGEAQTKSNQTADVESLRDTDFDFSLSASTLAVLEELNTEDSDSARRSYQSPKLSTSQNTQNRLLNRIPTHAAVFGSLASSAGVELGNQFNPLPSSLTEMQEPDDPDGMPTVGRASAPVIRSHSDMSRMVTGSLPIDTTTQSNVRGPPAAAASMTAMKSNERKLFRKSYSDTNALRNQENGNNGLSRPLATHGPPREERYRNTTDNDTGPWTAEAFDFFDWWPPGRPIPT
ncbi:hypothetical protein UA08_07047 [Talaromyces atroroseus]|uniref:5'-3' DNA helicase ZGRF1-like N-terminal domain-containing protein n=1 Tax=Talaromyces atroroseus TaxID=1441469 RepID=A0A225A995_TALAT|nr:hypothetical protein UA08_07047 [Talaromyces atroroseus]OKL57421.1 hypothetical protein UA08_07047 [Talaromyces atroroseus]